MRKIIVLIMIVAMVAAMSVTAFAVTPKWEYKPVKLPQIKPDTSFVQGVVANWIKTNPIDFPAIDISYTRPILG